MTMQRKIRVTTVGDVDSELLAFTVGRDTENDLRLIEADCIGTAAHVTMLSRMPLKRALFTGREVKQVISELVGIINKSRIGEFAITVDDQDVHMAVERTLTKKLGAIGRKIHTARSRNDQVAVDLRLFAKNEILSTADEATELAGILVALSRRHVRVPMVGRTHMQPAMPSSVGLWASAFAESLLDDVILLLNIYELNDQCPLGSAAGYGVSLPIDRELTSRLLGFSRPVHNVLHASNARGKVEALVLSGCGQVMLSLSRLAEDLILYSMPEFGYFSLPPEYCTGSSIMPQKNNPDVLELIRAKSATVLANGQCVADIVRGLPSGYNRDLQESKGPFMDGIATTRACLRAMSRLVKGLIVNADRLKSAFTPAVFAADRALELAGNGMPFRDAYRFVKKHLAELEGIDACQAVAAKTHLGAPGGLNLKAIESRCRLARKVIAVERKSIDRTVSKLLGVKYRSTGRLYR
ncbi:MAG: argininosuccinate lyase [bacterium]